jgi:hypothetical protein
MDAQSSDISSHLCAYCGSVLPCNIEGVEAWRIGIQFVCNEFCADGISGDTDRQTGLPAVAIVQK